jgi:hypothetical protein
LPGHLGFKAYCLAIAALPATGAQLAEATGLTARGATRLMRRLWQLRLVHPAGTGYRDAVIWQAGVGAAHHGKRLCGPLRPYANHILFASVLRALEEPLTAKALGEEVGISLLAAQTCIRHLRAAKLIYLSEWGRDSFGRHVARYELGKGKDAPKPRPQGNREKWARYRDRLTARSITQAVCRV